MRADIENGDSGLVARNALNANLSSARGVIAVTSDGFYNAFPSIRAVDATNYVMVYRKGALHALDVGTIVMRNTIDSGRTWSAERAVFSGAVDARDPSLTILSTGVWIISFFQYTTGIDTTVYSIQSDDNGITWSLPVIIPGYSQFTACSGPTVELANGSLLQPVYGRNIGDGTESAGVSISVDGGSTWSFVATLFDGPALSQSCSETFVLRLLDDTLYAIVRTDGNAHARYSTASADGLVWSVSGDCGLLGGRPSSIVMADGTIVIASRDLQTYRPAMCMTHAISTDNGVSYTTLARRASTPQAGANQMNYASMAEIAPGVIAEVFSYEIAPTRSDIYFRIFRADEELPPYFRRINADGIVNHGVTQNLEHTYLNGAENIGNFENTDGLIGAAASTTTYPSMSIPSGVDPIAPEVGDIWNASDVLKFRGAGASIALSPQADNIQTTSYTITAADTGRCVAIDSGLAQTWKIPSDSAATIPMGSIIYGMSMGAGDVTITPDDGVTIRSLGGALVSSGQYAQWAVRKRGANDWHAYGDLG